MSEWKTPSAVPTQWRESYADRGCPASIVASFGVPAGVPKELDGESEAEAFGPLEAVLAEWRKGSPLSARLGQLAEEHGRTAARRDELRGRAAALQAAVDEALYDGRQPDKAERQLEQANYDLRAAEMRLKRLDALIPAARKQAQDELRGLIEAERTRTVARLEAEAAKAGDDLVQTQAAFCVSGSWGSQW